MSDRKKKRKLFELSRSEGEFFRFPGGRRPCRQRPKRCGPSPGTPVPRTQRT
jgi:hypothetical protein